MKLRGQEGLGEGSRIDRLDRFALLFTGLLSPRAANVRQRVARACGLLDRETKPKIN